MKRGPSISTLHPTELQLFNKLALSLVGPPGNRTSGAHQGDLDPKSHPVSGPWGSSPGGGAQTAPIGVSRSFHLDHGHVL